jgi:hypothetical protein
MSKRDARSTPRPRLGSHLHLHNIVDAPEISDQTKYVQLHVRHVGVHGWDGTRGGRGDYQSEEALGGKAAHLLLGHLHPWLAR